MRPTAILTFEWLNFATLALGIIQSWVGWDDAVQIASPSFVIGVQIFTFALVIGLTLLVSRKRSNFAKWVLIILFVLGVPLVLKIFSDGMLLGAPAITALQTLGQGVALGFLFTPAARAWLHDRPAAT